MSIPGSRTVSNGSKHQRSIQIQRRLSANMLHSPPPLGAKAIKAQAVAITIDFCDQPSSKGGPLGTLPEVEASARNPA
jgi:hypothetical protein